MVDAIFFPASCFFRLAETAELLGLSVAIAKNDRSCVDDTWDLACKLSIRHTHDGVARYAR